MYDCSAKREHFPLFKLIAFSLELQVIISQSSVAMQLIDDEEEEEDGTSDGYLRFF